MKREALYIRGGTDQDGTFDFIRDLGGNPEDIAQRAGMDLSARAHEINFLEWNKVCRFFELTSQTLNEPYYGLKWALNIPDDLRNIGPVFFMSMVTENIRHLLDVLLPYLDVHTNGVKFEVIEQPDIVSGVITLHAASAPCRQYFEHIMATCAVLAYRFIPDFKLDKVTFQYSEPADMQIYNQVFQCPVYFNADKNSLVANRKYLGRDKTPAQLKIITSLLKSYLDWRTRVSSFTPKTMTELVTETLPSIMGAKNSSIIAVAEALRIHPKKLQRLLADEGTNYSQVLNNVRRNLAMRLLHETDISINRTAKILDYSSDRPFSNATQQWWGMSPSEYREAAR